VLNKVENYSQTLLKPHRHGRQNNSTKLKSGADLGDQPSFFGLSRNHDDTSPTLLLTTFLVLDSELSGNGFREHLFQFL
jgi:hypothetical protein